MAEDIRENAMSGGTPARLRGLAANGDSISPTVAEVMNAMPVATNTKNGLMDGGNYTVFKTANNGSANSIQNGTYYNPGTLTDVPTKTNSFLISFMYANIGFQIYFDLGNNRLFCRQYLNVWADWKSVTLT